MERWWGSKQDPTGKTYLYRRVGWRFKLPGGRVLEVWLSWPQKGR